MLRLLRFSVRNAADSPSMNGGPYRRVSSPPLGFSILITSAPISASSIVQNGPANIWLKSTTRIPASGSLFPSLFILFARPLSRIGY